MSHESSSRTDLNIPSNQRDLIKALKATGKPLVLVLMNGRPLSILEEKEQADAILESWFSGTEGGNAIAAVLFGDYNPSGSVSDFEQLYRTQLRELYRLLGVAPPALLDVPLSAGGGWAIGTCWSPRA